MDFGPVFDLLGIVGGNPLLKGMVIVFVYTLFAKGADIFIDKVLRQLAARTRLTVDDQLIAFLHRPICLTIFWFGVLHALVILDMAPPWLSVLPALSKTAILLIWIIALVRMFNWLVEQQATNALARDKVGNDLFLLLKNLLRIVIIIAGLLWLLAIWQINLTPLFASAGIAGIAIALAAKDTLANFFGGLSMFMDKAFKVGDFIIIDSGERGEVAEIGIRSTRIMTRDDVLVTIPNSILANSKIINESAPVPRFRIRVPIGVAYGSDLDQVEEVLLEVARNNKMVSPEPEPRVRLRQFADSSVNFELLCWVDDPSLKGRETHNLLKAIYKAFTAAGISIPFPQRDVHLIAPSIETK